MLVIIWILFIICGIFFSEVKSFFMAHDGIYDGFHWV